MAAGDQFDELIPEFETVTHLEEDRLVEDDCNG